jgi:hypothetical protein
MVVTDEGKPLRFIWHKRQHPVRHIANAWYVDDRWWADHIQRDYYKLLTTTGLLVVVYHDLIGASWYLQRLYD